MQGMDTAEAVADPTLDIPTPWTSELNSKSKADYERLIAENIALKHQIASEKMTMDTLRDDEKKVRYYTGLPSFTTLLVVFSYIEGSLTDNIKVPLDKFQKLMLVLMKLRHNFTEQDLAYRFGISQPTVSKIFFSVLHVLYMKLKKCFGQGERNFGSLCHGPSENTLGPRLQL